MASTAPLQHEAGIVRHVVRHTAATARLLVLGDAGCGKTALLRALSGAPLDRAYDMTAAPSVTSAAVAVPSSSPPARVLFVCVDCPGGSVFNMRPGGDVARGLLATAAAVAVCFDVQSRDSLAAAARWLRLVPPGLPGVLVGCKADLRSADRAEVGEGEAGGAAGALGLKFFEASAATGEGVRAPFEWLAGEVAAGAAGRQQ